MGKKARPSATDQPPQAKDGGAALDVRKLVAKLAGAKLSYGEPVRVDGRVVIPVARVAGSGGGGRGWGHGTEGDGGGGIGFGGTFESTPVGFIEIGAEGARFEAIPDPLGTARALRVAATGLTAALAGVVALRRRGGLSGGRARRLLSR